MGRSPAPHTLHSTAPTQVRDGRRALCPRGSVRPLVSQLTGDLLDHELPSAERDRVTGALSLQLNIDRSLPSHTNLPVDTAIMKSRPPGVTTALHSTLLFGAKSIAEILNLVGVRVVPSKASDRSLASSACPCSSSSIGPLLSSRGSRHTPGISLSRSGGRTPRATALFASRLLVQLTSLVEARGRRCCDNTSEPDH